MKNAEVSKTIMGLKSLDELKTDDVDIVFSIACNLNRLEASKKDYEKATLSLLKKLVNLDEAGNIKTSVGDEGRKYDFISPASEKEFVEMTNNLMEQSASVKLIKLKTSQLKKIKGITARIISDLMPLILDDDKTFSEQAIAEAPDKAKEESN